MIQGLYGLAESAEAQNAEALAASYGTWSGIRTNHVIGEHGNFSGSDGSSRSISTQEDRELLLALRSRADLVVVDAATARLEKYRAPSSGAPLAIFSLSGSFDGIPAVDDATGRVFLFTQKPNEKYLNSTNLTLVSIDEQPFQGFLSWAAKNNFDSVLLEAGPTLTRHAFEAAVVEQSAITRTPLLSAEQQESETNPFDGQAVLLSKAASMDASFYLWSH